MSIEISEVTKSFGAFRALDRVSLRVDTGELIALLGPSGCGKTTLLRILAGLEQPDSGHIRIEEEDATSRGVRERKVGFVFQHYALFRHMTVFDNVAFGLEVRPKRERPSKAQIRDKVRELLALVQLEWMADRYPAQLSGGQRQRVALARALAVEPRLLLLDEPFGALDAKVRRDLRRWLRRLHDELHVTSVLVTHDQEEALEVADRVVVMNEGRVQQVGTPVEVYDHPATPFVFDFIGSVNRIPVVCRDGRVIADGKPIGDDHRDLPDDTEALAYVRPQDLHVSRKQNGLPGLDAVVRYVATVGPTVRLELALPSGGDLLQAELARTPLDHAPFEVGERVFLTPRSMRVFGIGSDPIDRSPAVGPPAAGTPRSP